MTDELFAEILNKPESSILDFKEDLYNFSNDTDNTVLAKYGKDVLSFTNTIREQSAYIIFGVKELSDNSKQKIGITRNIDDAILQDKVKSKVYPLPKFSYSTKFIDGLLFGILEFPVWKYEYPITASVKLKGVEIGKTYFRQGSTNTEALSLDVIKINNWLQSLPGHDVPDSTQTTISKFLTRILSQKVKLSEVLPDLHSFAKSKDLVQLKEFCEFEIKGFLVNSPEIRNKIESDNERFKYRVQIIKISLDKIVHAYGQSPGQLKQYLNHSEGFFDVPYFFKESIMTIENLLTKTDGYVTVTMKVSDVLPDYKKDYPVYGYVFNNDFSSLYHNIKQKLIDLIMDLK
jgi:hypothetical protein